MTDLTDLTMPPVNELKALVDLLDNLRIDPLHLHAEARKITDPRPSFSLWIKTRTEFAVICEHLKAKPVERRFSPTGQREWSAEADTGTRRLLVQCVSFEHHDDWEPRPKAPEEPAEAQEQADDKADALW